MSHSKRFFLQSNSSPRFTKGLINFTNVVQQWGSEGVRTQQLTVLDQTNILKNIERCLVLAACKQGHWKIEKPIVRIYIVARIRETHYKKQGKSPEQRHHDDRWKMVLLVNFYLIQSRQVKHTLQDSVNELIIWKWIHKSFP